MDSVYSSFDSLSSKKVNIGEYFDQYHKVITEQNFKYSHDNGDCSTENFMPSSLVEEELNMLAEYCSIEKLSIPGELGKFDSSAAAKGPGSYKRTEIPKETKLYTLSILEQLYKQEKPETINRARKYVGEIFISYDKVESDGPRAVPGKDVLIFVRVYAPFTAQKSWSGRKIRMLSVITILGSQTLDKIRDLIDCVSDLSVSKETSKNPYVPVEPAAKDIYKSGFFYIEGTFYNDFRDSDNKDNSKVIRDWAKTHNVGPFATARMEDTRIDSLSLRFGYPWIYQHQGKCEHVLVFSDARLVRSDDELVVSAYPRIQRLRQRRSRCCMMCGIYSVRWIVFDSDRIPHDPCYLCDLCFKNYNYVGGEKIGNFKAYRFPLCPDLMREKTNTSAKTNKSS